MTAPAHDTGEWSDPLVRIAEGVRDQTRALDEQSAAIIDLDTRVARLEQTLAAQGGATAGIDAGGVIESLKNVRSSLKSMRNSEKRAMARLTALLSRVSVSLDPEVDQRFHRIAAPLVNSRRTMLDYDRLFTLWEAARNAAAMEGAAAEIGTYKGGSAALLSRALHLFAGRPRELHVVDTFDGHLETSFSEHDDDHQRGKFRQTQFDDVRTFLGDHAGTKVYMGDGPVVVAGWPERSYTLVHLDVDLYQPTIDCLRYFGPRLTVGGVIVVDDYGAAACPGISRAVHDYVDGSREFQTWRMRAEQIVLVKR